jgi:hypothetical protein
MLEMNLRVVFGWATTVIWLLLCALFLYNDWASAAGMKFNEWGDFLAGASAPLAFLWLVIGYFQQGEELGQNTKALKQQERALQLQVDELSQSVEQQNRSAVELGRQTAIAGLVARLNATNHMLESKTREIQRVSISRSDYKAVVDKLEREQLQYELSLEAILGEIELLEGSNRE